MLNFLYLLTFIISTIYLLVLLLEYKNRISYYFLMLFSAIMVYTFSIMQLSSATHLETAIFANQTGYLCACYSPFFLAMCIAELCKVKVKPVVQGLFIAFAFIVFISVSTVGMYPYYYKSVNLETAYGVSILTKVNGPLHIIYPLYLLVVNAVSLVMIVNAMRRRKEVAYATCMILVCLMVVVDGVYLFEKLLHLRIELIPFAYIVCETLCLILLKRVCTYDVASISVKALLENQTYGFILCNSNGKYLGSDDTAKKWFPEFKDFNIDGYLNFEASPILQQIGKWVRGKEMGDVAYLENGNIIVEISHSILNEKKTKPIHCFYLEDETQQQQYNKLVKEYNENLERDVNAKTHKLRKVQNDIIISMASIVENRDSNTGGHIARTSDIVEIFVEHLQKKGNMRNLTPKMADCIIKAAPLHDFGKIAIPDDILNKKGKFEDWEYDIMKQHSAKGAAIVERILTHSEDETFKKIAVNVAHYHHEKWDGSGYPEKISGNDIPFEARVMALADVFDALVSKRVYKESYSYDKAFFIIEDSIGSHFDPVLGKIFLECRPQLEELYDSYTD